MRTFVSSAAAVLMTLLVPLAAQAQVCVGNPALGSNSRGNVGLGVSFFDGGKGYNAGGVFGGRVFGAANFSYVDFDDTDLSFKEISGSVAYEASPSGSELSICPALGAGYGFGLEVAGIDVTSVTITPAVSMGLGAVVSPTVTVAPFAQAGLVYTRVTADAGPFGDTTETDTSGALVLGVGFIFNSRLSLGPAVYIPVAADGGDTEFSLSLVVAVGGNR